MRRLAREARINLVVSDNVQGTVTLKLEDKTSFEAIEVIATSKNLRMEKKDGSYFVESKNSSAAAESDKTSASFDEFALKLQESFTPALTKLYDSLLDHEAQPETAKKIARAKRALYDALIAEGFTKEEAFRLVLTHQSPNVPDMSQ